MRIVHSDRLELINEVLDTADDRHRWVNRRRAIGSGAREVGGEESQHLQQILAGQFLTFEVRRNVCVHT